ncbi:MAG TPA: MFS transporter [Jatrophihabitantaceae bacterium]|nr:MFS transporter [Jatrophihabitantaceae bacterium]
MSFRFRSADLPVVVVARALSLLGDEVAALTLTLRLQSHGAGPGAVATLFIAALVPLVVLAPLTGRVVDSYDSRRLLLITGLVQAGLCVLLSAQTGTAAILGLVLLLGVGQAVNGATWQALVPAIAGTERLARAMGLTQAAATVASVLSPALAGLLYGRYGARVPLLLDAATFLLVAVAALLVRTRHGLARTTEATGEVNGTPATADQDRTATTGLRFLRADPLLRPLLVLLTVFMGLGSMINVVDVFLIRGTLHASATWYGIVGAAFAVGLLGGALAAGRVRDPQALPRVFITSAIVLASGLAGMSLAGGVWTLLPVCLVVGLANGVLSVSVSTMVMGRAPEHVRGRVAATVGGIASGAQITAYILGGTLGTVLTPREVFALGGLLGLLAPLLLGRRVLRAAKVPGDRVPTGVAADCAA